MMEVMVVPNEALLCAKLQSNDNHQHINTQFFTGQKPFVTINQQCQITESQVIKVTALTISKQEQ